MKISGMKGAVAGVALIVGASLAPLLYAGDALACACCGTFKVVHVADDDVLNVRSGPGTGYAVVGSLPPGEGCIVKTGKRRGRWVHVEYALGKGWVHSYYLAIIK